MCATTLGLLTAVAVPAAASHAQQATSARSATGAKRTTSITKLAGARRAARAERVRRATAARRARQSASAAIAAVPLLPTIDLSYLAALVDSSRGGAAEGGALLAAAAAPGGLPGEPPRPFALFSRSATSMLDALTARARSQLGTRYVLGGDSPGGALDCSAFTRFAMEALGVRLPRTAAQQARVGEPVPRDRERLRPGDLLTFGTRKAVSHVGIYLGDGRFIHASVTSGRVIETTFERNARLLRRWLGARRLLAGADTAVARAATGS